MTTVVISKTERLTKFVLTYIYYNGYFRICYYTQYNGNEMTLRQATFVLKH